MAAGSERAGDPAPRFHRILEGEALSVATTPFGEVGSVFADHRMEVVWVSKQGEPIDPDWFEPDKADVLVVLQGSLKIEFESSVHADRVLETGDAVVLPPGCRCRAYRWPREAREATVFLAAYPSGDA